MGLDRNRGAKRARECRAELGLDERAPLACVLTLVEERIGVPVVVAPLGDGVAGALRERGGRRLMFVNGRDAPPRQRFTLAHELGHVRCGHDGSAPVETFATLSGAVSSSIEVQANAFAAELLVPRAAVQELGDRAVDPTLEELLRIAAAFGTSALMLLLRLDGLGTLDAGHRDRLRAVIDARAHEPLLRELDLPWREDRLVALGPLPYLSPSLRGTALDAAARGRTTPEAAAAAAGVADVALAAGIGRIRASATR